jgi:hypothetical protein
MDDGYCISQLKEFIDQYDILGVIVACTDQSAVLSVINKIQNFKFLLVLKLMPLQISQRVGKLNQAIQQRN